MRHRIELRVLGETTLSFDARVVPADRLGGAMPRRVLTLLALHAERSMRTDELADELWDRTPPRRYVGTLQGHVSRLRAAVQPGIGPAASVIRTVAGGYRLDADVRVDLLVAQRALEEAVRREDLQRLTELTDALDASDAVGGVLASEPWQSWAERLREQHRHRVADASTLAAHLALAAGAPQAARHHAERAVLADPAHEAGWRCLLRTAAATDDRVGAQRVWDRCRQALEDEAGVVPGAGTRDLYLAALGVVVAPPAWTGPERRRTRRGRRVADQHEQSHNRGRLRRSG